MRQRPENFNAAGEDPDATLVSPRFDADDARHAHPVIPLVETRRPTRRMRASRTRRSWTPALLAVALLASAALGGALAVKFTQQSPRTEQAQEQTQPAPVQTADAPPPAQPAAAATPQTDAPAAKPSRTRHSRTTAAAVEPAPEVAESDEDEHARKRREHDEDKVEKELRKQMEKAARHTKGKAPRLVDVLTGP